MIVLEWLLNPDDSTYIDTLTSSKEIKSRGAKIIAEIGFSSSNPNTKPISNTTAHVEVNPNPQHVQLGDDDGPGFS